MRFRKTICSIAAVLGLAASAAATNAPDACNAAGADWTVVASEPFETESCPVEQCTGITYTIVRNGYGSSSSTTTQSYSTPRPDYVAVLVEHDAEVVVPSSGYVGKPCAGDSLTKLGALDCSRKAVRLTASGSSSHFNLVVEGDLHEVDSSVVVKKSKTTERCLIASLGKDTSPVFDENAQVTTSETFDFKGCSVTIPTDVTTGEGGEATLTGEGCVFVANAQPVGNTKLLVDGKDVGFLTFGQGSVSSGTDSCTTKVINRRLYSWCTCADTNGDGVSDDPRPPCP